MQTNMPTAARLVAALGFAVVGFFAAEMVRPHLPEGMVVGAFRQISALIGLVCGWRILGPDVGQGMVQAANAGMRTALVMVLLGLLVFSTEEMIVLAFRRSYDTPLDAIIGVAQLAINFVWTLLHPEVLAVIFGGGALVGLLAEWTRRRWS